MDEIRDGFSGTGAVNDGHKEVVDVPVICPKCHENGKWVKLVELARPMSELPHRFPGTSPVFSKAGLRYECPKCKNTYEE